MIGIGGDDQHIFVLAQAQEFFYVGYVAGYRFLAYSEFIDLGFSKLYPDGISYQLFAGILDDFVVSFGI